MSNVINCIIHYETIFQFFKDFVTIVVSVCGVCIAYQGLHTRKRQLRGNDNYTIAKDVLEKTFDLREYVQDTLRCPFIPPHSQKFEDNYSGTTDSNLDELRENKVYSDRLLILSEKISKYKVSLLQLEIFLDKEIKDRCDQLLKNIYEIRKIVGYYLGRNNQVYKDRRNKSREKYESILRYVHHNEEDTITKEIDNIVQEIEDNLKKHL